MSPKVRVIHTKSLFSSFPTLNQIITLSSRYPLWPLHALLGRNAEGGVGATEPAIAVYTLDDFKEKSSGRRGCVALKEAAAIVLIVKYIVLLHLR